MPRFLVERRFHVTKDEMPAVNSRSKTIAIERFPQITCITVMSWLMRRRQVAVSGADS
jgi:hypothetical protein